MKLGVNIDHVATVRNARNSIYPDIFRAACLVKSAGADLLTVHLREDRRHIRDEDVARLVHISGLPMNLEIAATEEMVAIAIKTAPQMVCFVPERREEITTEGGLDAITHSEALKPFIDRLKSQNIKTTLFIDPDPAQLEAADALSVDHVEFHTGHYAHALGTPHLSTEMERIMRACGFAQQAGIECHAGHGLNFENVGNIAAIRQIAMLNIGHFLISEALFTGLEEAIHQMKKLIETASDQPDVLPSQNNEASQP